MVGRSVEMNALDTGDVRREGDTLEDAFWLVINPAVVITLAS
jgi:hypothetical protein